MSEESDTRLLVEISHLARRMDQHSEAQGRQHQLLTDVRGEIHKVNERMNAVEGRVERVERMATHAVKTAEDTALRNDQVHSAWKLNADALFQKVETVRQETADQTKALEKQATTLDRQDEVLSSIVAANEKAELHRQWQLNQAALAESAVLKRRATIAFVVKTIGAILAGILALWGFLKGIRPR